MRPGKTSSDVDTRHIFGERGMGRNLGFFHMAAWAVVACLAGCVARLAPLQQEHVPAGLPLSMTADQIARWEPVAIPGKAHTAYRKIQHDGRISVLAESEGSASMLRQRLRVPSAQLGRLQFVWQVDQLIDGADLRERDASDAPARVVLAFDGDRSTFSARNAMLNELTRALTGEDMPYAMLMYVWSNDLPVGTVVINQRTDRIRKIVVDSGPQNLRRWVQHDRDVGADFERAFGEAPGMLQGMAVMTDSDNTRAYARAWYGEIRLLPALRD